MYGQQAGMVGPGGVYVAQGGAASNAMQTGAAVNAGGGIADGGRQYYAGAVNAGPGAAYYAGGGMGSAGAGAYQAGGVRGAGPGVAMSTGAGCCGAGAGAGAAGSCTTNEYGTGALAYVGVGDGEYVAETTYKYVGAGRGDLSFVGPKRSMWPCCLVLLALIALAAVVLLTGTGSTTTSLKSSSLVRKATCTFWGDPHVETFDGGRPSFYGEGEYWIVKHPEVEIQGRYAGTKYTFGLASTQKVAVSGSFIGGHTIEVEPLEADFGGHIRIDGRAVLREFGTERVGGATVTYSDVGELVDEATSRWSKRVVHLELPKGIHMEVFRWGNYLDMRIRMAPLDGMDGSCGNFNGDASDDTTAQIFDRVGARVQPGANLFSRRVPVEFTDQMEDMLHKHCDDNTKYQARQKCIEELSMDATSQQMSACLFDGCFGANEHALQTAKTFASDEELREAHLVR